MDSSYLLIVSFSGKTHIVKYLLSKGANKNAKGSDVKTFRTEEYFRCLIDTNKLKNSILIQKYLVSYIIRT